MGVVACQRAPYFPASCVRRLLCCKKPLEETIDWNAFSTCHCQGPTRVLPHACGHVAEIEPSAKCIVISVAHVMAYLHSAPVVS